MSDDYEPHRAQELRKLSVVYPQVATTLCDAAEELESRARYFAQMQGSITSLALENERLKQTLRQAMDTLRSAESAERERDELRRENERLRALETLVRQLQIGALAVSRTGFVGLPLYEAALRDVITFRALTAKEGGNG